MPLVVTGKFSRQVLMITTKFTNDRHKKTQQTMPHSAIHDNVPRTTWDSLDDLRFVRTTWV